MPGPVPITPGRTGLGCMGGGCLYPKPGQLGVFCAGRELRLSQPQIPKGPLGIFLRPLPSSLVQGWGGGWQGCLLPHPRILPSLTLDSRTRGPGIQRGPEFLPKHLLAPHDSQGPKVQAQRKEAPAWGRGRGRARLAASRYPPPLPADTARDCQAVDDREPGQQPWQDFPGS